MTQDDAMSVKSSKSINDWEIIDEFYDPSFNTSSKATDMTLTKRNKYQGLEDFAKKITEDEAKKLGDLNKNEKKNWLIPALSLRLPSFLNVLGKKETPSIVEDKSLLLQPNSCEKKPQIRNQNRTLTFNPPKLNRLKTTEISMELQVHLDRISSNTKNTMNFNTKFPARQIKRRVSCDLKKRIELDESPSLKHRRKLSLKSIDNKDRIQFLQKLRPKIEENPNKTQGFKLTVSKIEQMMKNEEKKKEEDKIEEENEEEEKKIRKLGPWDEIWEDKAEFIQKNSPYGHFPSYKLRCLIVKGGDDLRQEILAMQLIIKFKQIFDKANIKLYIRPYEIIVTSANSGILGYFL